MMNLRRCHICGTPFPAEINAAICPRCAAKKPAGARPYVAPA
jgi:hypothetical protein